ncbi:calcium-binding protein [Mycobacterium sp. KBS0706]|uniref:calcium-binding protein n=1 Tax=Mycobacterium sp. KBS0706 TaxID=2578109 RepID=UPI00163D5AF5|nr:calcium-binding protein [Mycobacterium sp. KBS0706]
MAVINGDDNSNTLTGTSDSDTINGFGREDSIRGGDGNDILNGGDGGDYLAGGAGADTLIGGSGYDTLVYDGIGFGGVSVNLTTLAVSGGEADGDVISADFESILGSWFADTLTGSAGDEWLYASSGDDALSGLGGNDSLFGESGADVLNGGDGNDTLEGGDGADHLSGGSGFDVLSYIGSGLNPSSSGVTVNLTTLTASGGHAQGDVIGADFEGIVGGRFADNLTGNAVNNTLDGYSGNDSLSGMAGSDILIGYFGGDLLCGGTGGDSLDGGDGVDTATYYDSALAVTVDLAAGIGSGGDAQGDTLSGIENLTGSNIGGDTLTGDGGANILRGYGGDDLLRGGAGADSLFGDAGTDIATYYSSASGVTVDLAAGIGSGGDAQGDTLNGIENLTGSNVGGDTLIGGSGANILRGWGGNDLLRGGTGADTLDGGVGTDLASYYNSAAAVTLNLAAGTGTGGDAQGDILAAIENLNGSNFNDTLIGNGGDNALRGLAGRDTLTGGGGADRFVYAAASESAVGPNRDVITDFSHAQGDRIDLSLIDANTGASGNQVFSFIGAGPFTGVAGQLHYVMGSGQTVIAGDVNGDGTSDFHIALTGAITLVAGDFLL